MTCRILLLIACTMFQIQPGLLAQSADTTYKLSGIIYDEMYIPILATHVININTHKGDVTDSLGIFHLPVRMKDTLLIRNIAFRDTLVTVLEVHANRHIRLKKRRYQLMEARIFEWGTSYEDFKEAFLSMPIQQTLGASMGLPRQDPEKVPMEMDEKAIKNAGFLLTSPISFFYQNFSKHAKSARKVYWLKKNQNEQDWFETFFTAESLSELTDLMGSELEQFQLFLSQRIICDSNCSELEIYNEIYGLWDVFQDLRERGMLDNN